MIEKFLKLFKQSEPEQPAPPVAPAPQETKVKKTRKTKKITLSEKELATSQGEPWVGIVKVDVDPSNINSGSFTLDWNDKFVLNLIKTGYKQRDDDTDAQIVDRWFQTVCRNIALEIYEQQVADPTKREPDDLRRVQAKDIGNGRTEVS